MNAPVALTPELLTQLTAIVGENRIKTDADSLQNWGRDHTKHFDPNPSAHRFPIKHRASTSHCKTGESV